MAHLFFSFTGWAFNAQVWLFKFSFSRFFFLEKIIHRIHRPLVNFVFQLWQRGGCTPDTVNSKSFLREVYHLADPGIAHSQCHFFVWALFCRDAVHFFASFSFPFLFFRPFFLFPFYFNWSIIFICFIYFYLFIYFYFCKIYFFIFSFIFFNFFNFFKNFKNLKLKFFLFALFSVNFFSVFIYLLCFLIFFFCKINFFKNFVFICFFFYLFNFVKKKFYFNFFPFFHHSLLHCYFSGYSGRITVPVLWDKKVQNLVWFTNFIDINLLQISRVDWLIDALIYWLILCLFDPLIHCCLDLLIDSFLLVCLFDWLMPWFIDLFVFLLELNLFIQLFEVSKKIIDTWFIFDL